MKFRLTWLLILIALLFLSWRPVPAASEDELLNRIEQLERELNDLKKELQKVKKEKAKEVEVRAKEKEAFVEKGKKGGIMIGGFEFIPFGFFKVDASYDTSETSHGNFVP
ncbi:MAG: hypothetical protein ACOYU0_05000 [Nitrospirota bacterium]